MDEPTASFGEWLRRRRKALDLTQEALAQRAGYSLGAIRKLEADERRPSPELASHLVDALAVPVGERAMFLKVARGDVALDCFVPLPTPTAADVARWRLPDPLTRLIGREAEVAAVAALLRQGDVRLVTLLGTGGTGKTRLAIQLATNLQDEYADGSWFVDLAPLRDPALVAATIAHTLGLRETSREPLHHRLMAYLRDKRMLLLLDNFEQVVRAAPLVAELLAAAPEVKVLVTSRVVLSVYGEHNYLVPFLAVPDSIALPPLEQLAQNEAVQLFVERAVAAKADFVLSSVNAEAIAEICRRLDGMPLAIELAAARIRLLPPHALLARLSDRLTLLTGGARTLPPRQQTLRDTLAWSYDLLDGDEQTLFRRLAVFASGTTLQAVAAICDVDQRRDVVESMQSLIDHSLVWQGNEADPEPRFSMAETLREYALEHLAASGEEDVLRRCHAEYYLELAEAVEPNLRSAQQVAWGSRLEREHDNLRAALRWFISRGDVEKGLSMGGALWRFWGFCGHILEGRALLAALLALPGGGERPRAKALLGAGWLAHMLSDGDVAAALCERSAALYREVGDRWGLAFALSYSGFEMSWSNQRAMESAALFEQLGEPWGVAYACILRSELAARQGDARGRLLGQEGGRRFRELGDRWFLIEVLRRLEDVAGRLGDRSWHSQLLDELLQLTRDLGDKGQIARAIHSQALDARWQGDLEQAADLYDECVRSFRELGDNLSLASALHGRGMVAYRQGDDARAQALFEAALSLFREAEHQGMGWCLAGLAVLAGRQGQARRAARLLGAGDVLAHFDTWNDVKAPAAEHREIVVTARGQLDEAPWDAAWAEGQAMTLEQAIAYALSDET